MIFIFGYAKCLCDVCDEQCLMFGKKTKYWVHLLMLGNSMIMNGGQFLLKKVSLTEYQSKNINHPIVIVEVLWFNGLVSGL